MSSDELKSETDLFQKILNNHLKIKKNDESDLKRREQSIIKKNKIINEYEKRKLFYTKLQLTHIKKLDNKSEIKSINNDNVNHSNNENETKILDYNYKESPRKSFPNKLSENNILNKSKSQIYFYKPKRNITKYEIPKKKIVKHYFTKKYNFWVNPFSLRLNREIYKDSKKFNEKYDKIKKKRKDLSLEKYQRKLIQLSSLSFNRNTVIDLYKTFRQLRKNNSVKIEKSKKFIKQIEEKETKIYKNISNNQNKFIKVLNQYKVKIPNEMLPKIEMKTILKKKINN